MRAGGWGRLSCRDQWRRGEGGEQGLGVPNDSSFPQEQKSQPWAEEKAA